MKVKLWLNFIFFYILYWKRKYQLLYFLYFTVIFEYIVGKIGTNDVLNHNGGHTRAILSKIKKKMTKIAVEIGWNKRSRIKF